MSKFGDTRWADGSFSEGYREAADNFLPDRHKLIEIAASLHEHFLADRGMNKALDLGCGDGLLIHELLKADGRIEATLIDASPEMLEAAKKRLAGFENVRFIKASLQDLPRGDLLEGPFDFIVSSFAIHHLTMGEKEALFKYAYSLLNPGGLFANIDVVASPTEKLEDWYLEMWADWIDDNADEKGKYLNVTREYKSNPDNRPDTLAAQLGALERVGFTNVDCYHKFGVFAMFGGIKESQRSRN
jgi:tRNA (cmo5U34)-methyltransferase